MTVYAQYSGSVARIPITKCVLFLDFCANSFGSAPCAAAGVKCFNTWATCKDPSHYSIAQKPYIFTSADAPQASIGVPFPSRMQDIPGSSSGSWGADTWGNGANWGIDNNPSFLVPAGMQYIPWNSAPRPYLLSYNVLPTDISGDITVTQRCTVVMADEPDGDVGIDPYVSSRGNVPKTSFWRKLIARNQNYKNRFIAVYEGFLGMIEGDFVQRFIGKIESIKIKDMEVTIEAVDLIKSLDNYEVPQKVEITSVNALGAADTTVTLSGITGVSYPSGFIRIEDEIIGYSALDTSQAILTGCVRGAYDTVAAEHAANVKAQPCKFYKGNAFDLLQQLITVDGQLDPSYVNVDSFNYWKSFPVQDIDFDAVITEPTKVKDLINEIVNIIDLKLWVAEDLRITVARAMQNEPGRTYTAITDANNIINGSTDLNTNDASAITRCSVYFQQSPIGKVDATAAYLRAVIAINNDNEGLNGFNTIIEQKFLCRWISTRYQNEDTVLTWVAGQAARILFRYAVTMPILTFDLEMKDQDIKTGQYVKINTDEMLDRFGNTINDFFTITSRNRKDLNRITYTTLYNPKQRYAFIAPDGTPDFSSAADSDKEYNYISDDNGYINEEKLSYVMY